MTYNASNPKSLTLSGKYFSSLVVLGSLRAIRQHGESAAKVLDGCQVLIYALAFLGTVHQF